MTNTLSILWYYIVVVFFFILKFQSVGGLQRRQTTRVKCTCALSRCHCRKKRNRRMLIALCQLVDSLTSYLSSLLKLLPSYSDMPKDSHLILHFLWSQRKKTINSFWCPLIYSRVHKYLNSDTILVHVPLYTTSGNLRSKM